MAEGEPNDALEQLKQLSAEIDRKMQREARIQSVDAFIDGLRYLSIEPITYEELVLRQRGHGIADL